MLNLFLLLLTFQIDQADQAKLNKGLLRLGHCQVDFIQETYSDFMDPSRAEGTLMIQRPGKLRMEYIKGERKHFVCDGKTYYEYDQLADTESRVPFEDIRDEPLVRLLLFGDNPQKLFLIDRYTEDGETIYRFRPRDDESYHLEARFDKEWLPTYIEIISDDGEGTRFHFKNYRFSPQFSEVLFTVPDK